MGTGQIQQNVSDVSDATEEVTTGEFTEDGSDDEGRKTEWLAALEQGIHSREEFSALFDVDTLEDTRSFAGQDGIQYPGIQRRCGEKTAQTDPGWGYRSPRDL